MFWLRNKKIDFLIIHTYQWDTIMGENFQGYSLIQNFEADFL